MNNRQLVKKTIAVLMGAAFLLAGIEFSSGGKNGYAQTSAEEEPAANETTGQKIDRYHQKVGDLISGSAAWADAFFGTEIYTSEVNKTTLRLQLSTFLEEGEDINTRVRFRLRLKLPNTEKRFRFTLASDPDATERFDGAEEESVPVNLDETDDNMTAALEYFYLDRIGQNLKFDVGALVRDGLPVLYGSARYRHLVQLDRWTARFVERLRWYTDQGWDSSTDVDFERDMTEKLFFRTTPSLKWKQEEDGFKYSWTTSLYHSLDSGSALEYQFNNFFESELDGQLKEINVRVSYRRQVWRKWLIFEAAPQLAWYQARDFETVPGIMFRLEVWLGQFEEIKL